MIAGNLTQMGSFMSQGNVVDRIDVSVGGAGLVIGTDQAGAPVVVPFFSSEPKEVVSIGSLGFAKLIAFRTLAVGAQVHVVTSRPASWNSMIRMSAGGSHAINLVREFPDVGRSTVTNPTLVLIDSDASVPGEDQLGAPYVTVLTSYGSLSQWNAQEILEADLTIFQPLTELEAKLVGKTLGMGETADVLAKLPADVITVVTRSSIQAARVSQTSIEDWMIGSLERRSRSLAAPTLTTEHRLEIDDAVPQRDIAPSLNDQLITHEESTVTRSGGFADWLSSPVGPNR